MKCPICDSKKDLIRTTDLAPIRVGKRQFTVEVEVDKCDCGEIFVVASSGIAAEKLVAAHLAKHGHMDQEIFRFTRKALGLTAGALADKIGVSETTISRWENDKNEIPRSAAAVLSLMAMNDEAIPVVDVLKLLSDPRKVNVNIFMTERQPQSLIDLMTRLKEAQDKTARQQLKLQDLQDRIMEHEDMKQR